MDSADFKNKRHVAEQQLDKAVSVLRLDSTGLARTVTLCFGRTASRCSLEQPHLQAQAQRPFDNNDIPQTAIWRYQTHLDRSHTTY